MTHPDNLHVLQRAMASGRDPVPVSNVAGMQIQTSKNMSKTAVEWQPPPNTACIEYEESDHIWLRGLGFGSYVDTGKPLFVVVDSQVFNPKYYHWTPPPAPFAIRADLKRLAFF